MPEAGSVDAGACLHAVEVLSEEAVVAARSRLNPAAGVMLSALWVGSTGQLVLIIHHLAVDGVSWRIVLEDLNIAWAQHRGGQPVALPAAGTSFARWASLLAEHARRPEVVDAGRRVAAGGGGPGRAAGGAARGGYVMPAPGSLSVALDVETTRMLLGEVPAAFHAGIQDILLIAFGLACGGVFGSLAARRSVSMWRATAATRNWPPMWTCRARWGGSPPNIRWSLARRWAGLGAGDRRRGRRWGRCSRTPKSSFAPCPIR